MRLSVVVTIVDSGDALRRCLSALSGQQDPPAFDVIVPWDDTVAGIPELSARFLAFHFLPIGHVATERPAHTPAGQHELFDRRRAAGLAAASGDIVAILEDRSVPRPDWARTLLALHERLPHAVIGGAIENGRDLTLNWAVYFCDFGRYQLPFEGGPREWVSDVNVGYKRRALESTRPLWRERYHETTVHWALRRSGETLYLAPELVVDQVRGELTLAGLLRERFAWGRVFAYTRARERTAIGRLGLALMTPFLPGLLANRLAVRQATAPETSLRRFLKASPAVILLLTAWSAGEAAGYITGRP
jgi:hypothetical protein